MRTGLRIRRAVDALWETAKGRGAAGQGIMSYRRELASAAWTAEAVEHPNSNNVVAFSFVFGICLIVIAVLLCVCRWFDLSPRTFFTCMTCRGRGCDCWGGLCCSEWPGFCCGCCGLCPTNAAAATAVRPRTTANDRPPPALFIRNETRNAGQNDGDDENYAFLRNDGRRDRYTNPYSPV